jgi:hypothetical protein
MYACLFASCTNPARLHIIKTPEDGSPSSGGSYQGWSFCSPEHARAALQECHTFRQFENTYA